MSVMVSPLCQPEHDHRARGRPGYCGIPAAPILGAGIILAAAGSSAQSFDRTREPAETIASLLTLAEAGDAEAQFRLGRLYQRDSSRNGSEWYRWTLAAAERGHVIALVHIGLFHAQDLLDPAEGADWYLRAAQLGGAGGQLFLGEAYLRGWGVPQNDRAAVRLLQLAAEEGNAEAQYLLGRRLLEGRGLAKDELQAFKWLNRAAGATHSPAQLLLASLYPDTIGEPLLDSAAVAKLRRRAASGGEVDIFALRLKAEDGDPEAQARLGFYFRRGFGVPRDLEQAHFWLLRAVEQDDISAQSYLAELYLFDSPSGKPEERKAAALYRRAAEQGHEWAQLKLGKLCFKGRGVSRDLLEAYVWVSLGTSRRMSISDELLLQVIAGELTAEQLDEAGRRIEARRSE